MTIANVWGWAGAGRAHPRRRRDRGAASLWLLAAGFVLVAAGLVGAAVGAATVARHRAQAAADLGALAGAMRAAQGAEVACARAGEIVAANAGRVTDCRVDGLDVLVSAQVRVTGVPGLSRSAVATARAGPVRDALSRPASGAERVEHDLPHPEDLPKGLSRRPVARWLDPGRGFSGQAAWPERRSSCGGECRPGDLEEVSMELSLSTRIAGDHTVLQVGGEVDVYTAPRLRERLVELVDEGARRVIVDLGTVEFLDSTGLGVLVGAHKRLRAAGGSLALVCTREPLLKIFRITALDQVFPLYDTVDAATAEDTGAAR